MSCQENFTEAPQWAEDTAIALTVVWVILLVGLLGTLAKDTFDDWGRRRRIARIPNSSD